MKNAFFSWRTTKTAAGFEFVVSLLIPSLEMLADGTYCKTIEVNRDVAPSRAIAKARAQKLVRYYNAKQAKSVNA